MCQPAIWDSQIFSSQPKAGFLPRANTPETVSHYIRNSTQQKAEKFIDCGELYPDSCFLVYFRLAKNFPTKNDSPQPRVSHTKPSTLIFTLLPPASSPVLRGSRLVRARNRGGGISFFWPQFAILKFSPRVVINRVRKNSLFATSHN